MRVARIRRSGAALHVHFAVIHGAATLVHVLHGLLRCRGVSMIHALHAFHRA